MARRFLFGPVSADFAEQNLYTLRQAGQCLAFSHRTGTDLHITNHETWESLGARLPPGWQPDFLVLNLAYQTIPPAFWQVPVPLIALAPDWNFTFHGLRRLLPFCDLVVTDTPGVATLRRHGFERVLPAILFGLERAYLEAPPPSGEYTWDVLFVGNLHSAVQRERLSWLGRLANRADHWRVRLATGVFGEDYRTLLRRSRIVFNRSVRGECNRRVFEAAASGALVFQENDNTESAALFRDRRECVCYTDDNLEELLDYYLTHEDERRAIAEAGRQLALRRPYAFFWNQVLAQIEQQWPHLQAQRGPATPTARWRGAVGPHGAGAQQCGWRRSSVSRRPGRHPRHRAGGDPIAQRLGCHLRARGLHQGDRSGIVGGTSCPSFSTRADRGGHAPHRGPQPYRSTGREWTEATGPRRRPSPAGPAGP